MMAFLKKYKLWLSVSITGILTGAAFFFGAYKLVGNIETVSSAVQEKTVDNEYNQSRITKIPEMEAAQRSFQERETDLDATLDESKEIDFIKKLEALAEITGNRINLKINDQDQKSATAAQSAKNAKDTISGSLPSDKYITMQINLEGGYAELVNFVHKIENFGYYANIISINAAKNTTGQSQTQDNSASPFSASRAGDKIILVKEAIKTTLTVVVYLKK